MNTNTRMMGRVSKSGSGPISDEVYYNNWPSKCLYNDDVDWGCSFGIKYLQKMAPVIKQKNITGIVVFDIDDTLVQGDPASVVGIKEMEMGIQNGQDVFILPVNHQVVKLAQISRQLGYKIVILTARPMESKMASIRNLEMFNIPYDMLIMNDKNEDPCFKIRIRRSLENKPNQQVILTIGDQPCDCFLPGRGAFIKLPDPESKCCYAYIP